MSSSSPIGPTPEARDAPIALLLTLGVGLPVLCSASLLAGLDALLLPGGSPTTRFALHVPGLLVGACLLGLAALRRLAAVAPRWHPGDLVVGLERRSERPAPTPRTPAPLAPRIARPATPVGSALRPEAHADPHATSTFGLTDAPSRGPGPGTGRPARAPSPELALVHLGPRADPAWAAWGLRWEAPGHGAGFVPLPPGARLVLGRDPDAEVVVRLDQVSWHHLELDVRDATVSVRELGSSNGTSLALDAGADPAEVATALGPEPVQLAAGDRLHLAHPTALVLTLEALR